MKLRKFKAAAALGSLTATVALLAGMSGANAQGAPGAGSFPGSILLPGTQTSFKVGGYVKLDYTYDFSVVTNSNGGLSPGGPLDGGVFHGITVNPGSGHNIHGRSQMQASESRFNIETRTPTGYGELKTYIEGDFTNPNGLTNSSSLHLNTNSYGFRLRYAYGTLGPLLAGQFNSLFRDSSTEPETLDFGGAIVAGATRQPQVRYTFDFGNGLTLAGAVEQPQTDVASNEANSGGTTFGTGHYDKIPDFTAALKYSAPWGAVALRGVVRDLYWHDGVSGSTARSSTLGWALGASGTLQGWWGKDNVGWQINGGVGGGRYVMGTQGSDLDSGVSVINSTDLKPIGAISAMVQYQHWWTDMLRSTVAGSYAKMYVNSDIFPTCSSNPACLSTMDKAWTVHVNLIWSPVPQVDLGVEWMRMNFTNQLGQESNPNRFQASAKFKF